MTKQLVVFICVLCVSWSVYAQNPVQSASTISKDKMTFKDRLMFEINRPQRSNGHFGIKLGSPTNDYISVPLDAPIDELSHAPLMEQDALPTLSLPALTPTEHFRKHTQQTLPALHPDQWMHPWPEVTIDDVANMINQDAIATYISQQLTQLEPMARAWEPHWVFFKTYIENNLHNFVDIPAVASTLWEYIQNENLINALSQDAQSLANMNWGDIPWEDFYDAQALDELLHAYATSLDQNIDQASSLLNHGDMILEATVQSTIAQGLAAFQRQGFVWNDQTLTYQDPRNTEHGFAFIVPHTQANGNIQTMNNQDVQAQFDGNIGRIATFEGFASLDTSSLEHALTQEAFEAYEGIVATLTAALEGDASLSSLIADLQGHIENLDQQALDVVMQTLTRELESDLNITISLDQLSQSFQGQGKYLYIDVVLETLGHDIGSVTLDKENIVALATMMSDGSSSTDIGYYVFEDIGGMNVDRISYRVARDITNTFLTEHFQGNMMALQHSINSPGGLIQQQNAFFGSATIWKRDKFRMVATGTFNQRSVNSTPLVKDNGLMHARTVIRSHSLGLVVIPTLWSNPASRTQLDGFVQIEGLYITPESARVMTHTSLMNDHAGMEPISLYDVNFGEFEDIKPFYIAPMASAGVNLQQKFGPHLALNGYLIAYPGLKQTGDINNIQESIALRYQTGVSMIFQFLHDDRPNLNR